MDVLLEGHRELRKALGAFAAVTQRKIVRPAVSKALTPINKAAKRKCPVDTKALRKSIGKRVKANSRTGTVWGGVGPRKGWPDEPGRRIHFIEYGTKNAAAQPFLRPALDENREEALRILAAGIHAGIEKEAAKQRAKGVMA